MRVWRAAVGAASVLLCPALLCQVSSQVWSQVVIPVAAVDARFERSLRMLAPAERLEQLCDYTALTNIRKDSRGYRPDRAVARAGAEVTVKNDTIVASSGAFRSRGKWYVLSYTCSASPDHMQVLSFKYAIGGEIPEAKWAAFGLWD
jgi:hypothetical protein